MIIDSLRKVGTNSSRIRTILPGDKYILPPQQDKLNLLEVPIPDIISALQAKTELKLSKAILDTCLGFGPVTAKETAFGAGLPNNIPVAELNPGDWQSLADSLAEIKESFQEPCGQASIVVDKNNKLLASASFPLHYFTEENTLTFDTIAPC